MSKATPRPKPEQDGKTGRFVAGNSGNGGRPKGSRNKLGEAFIDALHEDFEEHGSAAIQTCRSEKPEAYLRVIAMLLPKDVNLNVNRYDDTSDADLLKRLRQLDAALGPFIAAQGEDRDSGDAGKAVRH